MTSVSMRSCCFAFFSPFHAENRNEESSSLLLLVHMPTLGFRPASSIVSDLPHSAGVRKADHARERFSLATGEEMMSGARAPRGV
jgi:hypothetical protein